MSVSNFYLIGIKRKAPAVVDVVANKEQKVAATLLDKSGKILGKTYFRDPDVNNGFYSKKREGVADVDPKVNILKSNSLSVTHVFVLQLSNSIPLKF